MDNSDNIAVGRIASAHDPVRVLIIEDSKGDVILVKKALARAMPEGCDVGEASNMQEALRLLSDKKFDVALLDRSLPDTEGFEGLYSLQNMAPQLPVIFITSYSDEKTAFEAIEKGAQDYLFKDKVDGHTIRRAIQYALLRKQFEGVLIMRANFDMLTGLANRSLFENRLDLALSRIKRYRGCIAVMFLDLNRFKHINDAYGHAMGDKLLKEVGVRLSKILRPNDTVARFGGDEFAILLEGMSNPENCDVIAGKIIKSIDAPFFILGQNIEIGVSIGIATAEVFVADGKAVLNAKELMKESDLQMYKAKASKQSAFQRCDRSVCP
jgi:diguanylate cyclase (GGDEF)-like protein